MELKRCIFESLLVIMMISATWLSPTLRNLFLQVISSSMFIGTKLKSWNFFPIADALQGCTESLGADEAEDSLQSNKWFMVNPTRCEPLVI